MPASVTQRCPSWPCARAPARVGSVPPHASEAVSGPQCFPDLRHVTWWLLKFLKEHGAYSHPSWPPASRSHGVSAVPRCPGPHLNRPSLRDSRPSHIQISLFLEFSGAMLTHRRAPPRQLFCTVDVSILLLTLLIHCYASRSAMDLPPCAFRFMGPQ